MNAVTPGGENFWEPLLVLCGKAVVLGCFELHAHTVMDMEMVQFLQLENCAKAA